MFNKKRKQRQELDLNMNRLNAEVNFAAAIEKAEKIADPVEKILALRKVSIDIDGHLIEEESAIKSKAKKSGDRAWWGTWGTGMATTASALLLTGPVGIGVALAGGAVVVASGTVDALRKKHVAKKLLQSAATHTEKVTALKALAEATLAETVENNVDAISTSPIRDGLLELPGISEIFSAAAAKHIAETKENPAAKAEAEKVPEEVAPKPEHKPADYSLIKKGVLNRKPKQPKQQ